MPQGPLNIRHAIAPPFYFGANAVVERIGSVQLNCRFQFHKRSQLFSRVHNVTLSVAAMRVSNKAARARYVLVWRPRFLAALAMCHLPELAARHTRISCQMAYYHRKHDPEFAKQWDEAREYGIEMLHARAFQRALEGDLEPVYYMGVPVGYIRSFDSKLQIEMLRGYRPDRSKSAGVNVNLATKGDVFVLTEEQRHELQRINRAWLEAQPLPAAGEEQGGTGARSA